MTTVQTFSIADGDVGTAQTVEHIAAVIRASVAQPLVRGTVSDLVAHLGPTDYLGQLYAIRDWLSSVVRFLRDPAGVELLHTPEWMLNEIARSGAVRVDCDDAAIMAGALAGAIGFRVVLVTVAFLDKSAPMSHIWTSASPPVRYLDSAGEQVWIELDVTRPMQALPLESVSRSKVFPVLV